MASMDDLIATISGGLHAGQQGNDLKDLHAKLTQTLHPTVPTYRPIPPSQSTSTGPSQMGHSGPIPPPAPVSSWNSPPPAGSAYLHPEMFPRNTNAASSAGQSNGGGGGLGGTYLSASASANGVPAPRQGANGHATTNGANGSGKGIPYHAEVLPVRASPKDTGGFADDAFKPLWSGSKQ